MEHICSSRARALFGFIFTVFLAAACQTTALGADRATTEAAFSDEGDLAAYIKHIKQRATANSRLLRSENVLPRTLGLAPSFRLPLAAPDVVDSSYYCILYYVDHDSSDSGVLDWNCGTRTYNGHTGTDFFIWPFAWYKMDTAGIEAVAASDGLIVDKADGNFDRCCDGTCGDGNYVVLEHGDGSRSMYLHLKNGSVTAKAIGQPVLKGEVLGEVGSSGESGGPHLHFEVWDSTGAVVDPFVGSCSSQSPTTLGTQTLWDNPEPYYNPTIIALITHSSPAEYLDCPGPASPNATDLYAPGGQIIFASYHRDVLPGDITYYTVTRPDESTQWTWTWTSPSTYQVTGGCLTGYYTLPEDAPTGRWTFAAVLRGKTYTHYFYVQPSAGDSTAARIYMDSATSKMENGVASASCGNSQEEIYQHTSRSGVADIERMTVYTADMTQIPQGATITAVDAHLWAKRVANTRGGRFKIYVNTGDSNSSFCSACMNWTQALAGCDIDGTTDSLVFSNSNTAVGRYVNYDMTQVFTDKSVIRQRAIDAHANYSQYNHYLFFRCLMQVPSGGKNTYADGYMHGEAAVATYKPYVDITYLPPEYDPPVPDPALWAADPYAPIASTTSLAMSAFPASDATPPVQYYFECTSGGAGATGRNWSTSRQFTDDGLSPNTQYSYQVKTRDSGAVNSQGGFSAVLSAYTRALTPPQPAAAGATYCSVDIDPAGGSNPSYTELAVWNETLGYWVDAGGGNGGPTPTWRNDADWGVVTVTGLEPLTTYCFRVEARNGDGLVTAMGDSVSITTEDCASVDGGDGRGERMVFSVAQATPNPATGLTQIGFTLPEEQAVRICIYDVSGRLVRSALDQAMPAGRHQARWDGRDRDGQRVQPGTYFMRLVAGPHAATRKLVVVR